MWVKEESKKAGQKLYIQKTKIMAQGPIILWQTEGEKLEAITNFILGDSKITWTVVTVVMYECESQGIKKAE